MEYNPGDGGGKRSNAINPRAPTFIVAQAAIRNISTAIQRSVTPGSSRQHDAYLTDRPAVTPRRSHINTEDYSTEDHSTAFANQDYTSILNRSAKTDPGRQPDARFPSLTPESTRSQPMSYSTARFQTHQGQSVSPPKSVSLLKSHDHGVHHTSQISPTKGPKSVKHLTCFYWRTYGKCNKADENCLYSHYHTGQLADEPKVLEPGRPAVAGRNARSKAPVYQNWRKNFSSPERRPHQTPSDFRGNNAAAYVPGNGFQYKSVYPLTMLSKMSSDSDSSPRPESEFAKRFFKACEKLPVHRKQKMSPDFLKQQKVIKKLLDIVKLQQWMTQQNQEFLISLKEVNESIINYVSSAKDLEYLVLMKRQVHIDALVDYGMKLKAQQLKTEAMIQKLDLLDTEVRRELVTLSSSLPSSQESSNAASPKSSKP